MSEAARIERIRGELAALSACEWLLSSEGDGMGVAARGEDGSLVTFLRFEGTATSDEMQFVADAPGHVRFLLGLVDRAIARLRPPPDTSPPASDHGEKNFAAEAAMKCGEPWFKKFLMERHGLESPATDERAAQRLRSLLGIVSRRELNADDAAAARWKKLRGEFEQWRRLG